MEACFLHREGQNCSQGADGNHTPDVLYTDITRRKAAHLPDIDIYCAGPPCQDYSKAGTKTGDSSERGSVIFNCVEAIVAKKPKIAVLENVPGMQQQFPHVLKQVMDTMRTAHYSSYVQELDTLDFGLPQSR